MSKKLLPALLVAFCAVPGAHAVELLAAGRLDASGGDLSAATAAPLENGVAGNRLGGLGSGLAYTGGNTFIAVPDRGPNAFRYNPLVDDTTSYIARFHTLNMSLTATPSGSSLPFKLTPNLIATTLLSSPTPLTYGSGALGTGDGHALGSGAPALNDGSHHYFTGRSDNFDPAKPSSNPDNGRLDMEAVRVANDGKSIFVSDEYGPYLYQFDRASGARIASYALPANLAVRVLSASGHAEIAANTSGRIANKGMEGLALTPDGKVLVGIMQANLEQDEKKMLRIVSVDIATKVTHEYAYQLTTGKGVSEIVALNDHQFLVDERDGKGLGDHSEAVVKQLFMVDLDGANDVSDVVHLTSDSPALHKSLFLDLVALLKANGYAASQIPSKIEGLAFGADVTVNGARTHTLYVSNDNDFLAGDNQFYVLGVSDADLARVGASYTPQATSAAP